MLQKRYGVLQSVTEHNRALWDVTRSVANCYVTLRERYKAVTLRYGIVMENINFAHTPQNANDVMASPV